MSDDLPSEQEDVLARMEYAILVSQLEEEHRKKLEGMLREIIEVRDSLERLLKSRTKDPAESPKDGSSGSIWKSLELLDRQFETALDAAGVQVMTCVGKAAEPGVHEIFDVRASNDVDDDVILEEQQRGYIWEFGVLRRPVVIVAGSRPEQ